MVQKILQVEFDGWRNDKFKTEARIVGDIQLLAHELANKLYMKDLVSKDPYVVLSLKKPDGDHELKLYELHNWTEIDISDMSNWIVTDQYIVLRLGSNPYNEMVHTKLVYCKDLLHLHSKDDIFKIVTDVVKSFEPSILDENSEVKDDFDVDSISGSEEECEEPFDVDSEPEEEADEPEEEADEPEEEADEPEEEADEPEEEAEEPEEEADEPEEEAEEEEAEEPEDEAEEPEEEAEEPEAEDEAEELANLDELAKLLLEDAPQHVSDQSSDDEERFKSEADNKPQYSHHDDKVELITLNDLETRKYKLDKLKELCKYYKLKVTGSKGVLSERIISHLSTQL
jgi:hypothetical protein